MNRGRIKGYRHSAETKAKMAKAHLGDRNAMKRPEVAEKLSGRNSYLWKEEGIGYSGIHYWIRKVNGLATKCSHCGLEKKSGDPNKKFQWANISGNYLRDINDWIALCASCHKKYDQRNRKSN